MYFAIKEHIDMHFRSRSLSDPLLPFASLLFAVALGTTSRAQVFTTAFQETFTHGTTTNNPASGSVSATAGWVAGNDVVVNGSRWYAYTTGQHGVRIVSGRLQITGQRGSSTAHAQGMAYVICGGPGSSFDNAVYNPVLKNNPGIVRWSFNIQRGPAGNGGFSCSGTANQNNVTAGAAYVLATNAPAGMMGSTSTCSPTATAVGYAVTVGNGQPTRLVRFDQGLHNSDHTVIATAPNIAVANVRSVRVTYDPSNDQWTLSTRSDQSGSSTNPYPDPLNGTGFSTPAVGIDGVHVNTALNYQGAYNQAGCIGVCDYVGAGSSSSTNPIPHGYFSNFDNITVEVEQCTPLPTPGPIAGSLTVCQGGDGAYSIDAVPGATGYTWTYSGVGAVLQPSGTSVEVSFTTGASSGTLAVSAEGGCPSEPSEIDIQVDPLPTSVAPITGEATVCEGATVAYSTSGGGGDAWYVWTLPNGWSGTSDAGSITATAGASGGTITVVPNNACGAGPAADIAVSVSPAPEVTLAAFDPVCVYHDAFTLGGGSPAGGEYTVNGTSATTFDPGAGAGTYTVVYTYTDANGCTASDSAAITVDACTGLAELTPPQVAVFPNPVSDVLTVRADRPIREARLLDAMGRVVLEASLRAEPSTTVQLHPGHLPAGMHMLEVIAVDGGRIHLPVIKDR